MKIYRQKASATLFFLVLAILYSCSSPGSLTSWKNPKQDQKISYVAVWGMFNQLEYQKKFEEAMVNSLKDNGIKAMEANSMVVSGVKYTQDELDQRFDSTGVDAILMVSYTGISKKVKYIAPATNSNPYYSDYTNYYVMVYPYTTGKSENNGGHWKQSKTLTLEASLYHKRGKVLLWKGEFTITDPDAIKEASYRIAATIYSDWKKNQLIGK